MTRASTVVRSLIALLVGLGAISLFAETLELALVTLVAGEVVSDPTEYFAIRNQTPFLTGKLAYNTVGAAIGGMLTAVIARRRPMWHAALLAAIQIVALGWALSSRALRSTGPLWMWLTLIPLSAGGILLGAGWAQRRATDAAEPNRPRPAST